MKETSRWYSERVEQEVHLVRWGHYGTPVLLYATAGGDAEEAERFQLIEALGELLEAGRIKVYSMDSIAGRAWLERKPADYCARLQNRFDAMVYHEIVPAIRADCRSDAIEIIAAGASIGAFNAVAALCRHPDVFRIALGMSGTYDLERFLYGGPFTEDLYFSSPLHYLPGLGEGSEQLRLLRQRFAVLAFGQGRWEDPSESWRLAEVLGARGVPNRIDAWGPEWDHDWPTWRVMLPRYLADFC